MSEEFVREVDEISKRKRGSNYGKKYFLMLLVFPWYNYFYFWICFWNNYTESLNQQLGDDFTAAVQLANEEDLDASIWHLIE